MAPLIHILHLEDDPADAELIRAKIMEMDLACRITRVQTRDEFDDALKRGRYGIIIADYRLPMFDGLTALRMALEMCPEIPFIFVSDTLGEEAAIEALTKGATDYVLKKNLSRLAPAVKRALQEVENRRERRQAQKALQRSTMINAARIHLMQFAAGHSLDDLLEETVNQAEKLTDSLIGFYHLVDDDEQALTLQNWSTRTKARFCKARSKGLHFPISDSGVWADCVRQRKPIVHNDYASLTHGRGLPEGHAPVVRELVVPVLRGNKIKAVLGMGNKPVDYAQKDVEAISLLADLAWEITERKQVEAALVTREHEFRTLAENLPDNIVRFDREGRTVYINPVIEKALGAGAAQMIGKRIREFHTDGSYEAYAQAVDTALASGKNGEIEFIMPGPSKEPIVHQIRMINERDEDGEVTGVLAIGHDITEHMRAEKERQANLRFFESMDRVNRAIQGADDLEEMMKDLLEEVLSIFDCDRAFLMYPCDPESDTWTIPMECSKPGYAGSAYTQKREMPMEPAMVETLRVLIDSGGPMACGPGTDHPLSPDVWERHGFRSMISMVVHPKMTKPWQFGIHQCDRARVWNAEETRVFEAIGRRLADGLTSILAYRNLKESEAEYRQIVDTANEGILVSGPDDTTTFVNARMAEILGHSCEAMIGRPLTDFMFEEDVPDHVRKIENRRQGMPECYERRFRHRDGRTIWTHVSATPIFDGEHRSNGAFAMFSDITDNKRAQIRLNEQLHFLQQLLDSIPIPVYYKDKDGLYLGCNAAFEAFIGSIRKDIIGKTIHQLVPKERADRHHEADMALLSHPGEQTYEVSGINKDGNYRDVIFNKASFVDAHDRVAGTVGVLMDITERKEAERQRLANLRFFECMDRVNRAIQGADDLEAMMKDLLDEVLSIFDCDRAFLVYPCDPESPTWNVPMERNKPEYPGVRDLKQAIQMDPQIAEKHRILLAAEGPVAFGPGTPHMLPEDISKQFGFKGMLAMAIYPKTNSPWEFGIHQCAYARVWTAEEMRVFEAIGRRLTDSLSSLRAYRDLGKSEEFLDNVVEHIPNMIFVKDAQTLSFVRINRAGERLLGYSREELLGKTDYDLFPEKAADRFTAKDSEVLNSNTPIDIPEEVIVNKNQDKLILHTKKIPLVDESGVSQFLLGISEDITERKQAEASIRQLSLAIAQSPVSIIITDVKGTIEFVNTKFTQVTGYSSAEALGQTPRILKSGKTPPEEYSRLWRTIRSGGVWRGAFHNRKKNGDLFWEQATIAPVRNVDNVITHYVAVKEDITERKKLEAQLIQAQKMESVGRLAGGVAHDFNNMLGVITGYAEMALDKLEPDNPLFGSLNEIFNAAKRSAGLTRQLLAFARRQVMAPKVLDLNRTVEGMLKMLRRLIGEDIDLVWLPDADVWPVKMDPAQIDQILANLCVNARDAIADGGKITIETGVTTIDEAYCADHAGFVPGDFVVMTVSDDGQGMDKATLSMIFEPFFTTKELGKGTGLGMATVYGIVKQNEGFINVYSEPGYGTTFRIYLPRHVVTNARAIEKGPATAIIRGHETILLVEDEPAILDLTQLMLARLGYEVLAAATPDSALRLAAEHPGEIQLLITDVIMPNMNGRELAKRLLSLRPAIHYLFMSGYTEDVIAHHAVLDEGIHFIQKPFSFKALATKVREVLDEK